MLILLGKLWLWFRPQLVQPDPAEMAVVTRIGFGWIQLRSWAWHGDRLTLRIETWNPTGRHAWASVVRGGEVQPWEQWELPQWRPEWN